MPILQQNVPEPEPEKDGPSTTELTTSSQSSSSRKTNTKVKDSAPKSTQPRSNKQKNSTPVCEVNNVQELMACLKVNNAVDESKQQPVTTPTGKNAKKKRNKQLHLTTQNSVNNINVVQNSNVQGLTNNLMHDFLVNGHPLYASTSSRYLENIAHHPQFQYMQSVQEIEQQIKSRSIPSSPQGFSGYANSVPNTPLLHLQARPGSVSIPCSPVSNGQVNLPFHNFFMQNILQHPLLYHSYSIQAQNAVNIPQGTNVNNTPKNKQNTNKEPNEDKKFENYMTAEEVEAGLKNNTLIEGVIRINPKQFQHSYISSYDRDEQDVFIDGLRNRNRALEGDKVVVQLIESDSEDEQDKHNKNDQDNYNKTDQGNKSTINKQKKGKVVYIKEKVHTRNCIGILKLMPDKNRQRALFIPRDHRIPRLNIPFTCWPDNFYQESKSYENVLFLAKVTEWYDTRFALGRILCNIGVTGNIKTESMAILAQNDLDVSPFGPEVRDLFPRLDYTIPEEEIKIREDCRKLCIFSIDPYNCRDIDDALSCKQLENGNFEIGVHISDVAHYLKEDTILDEKVADKATTIYLVEKAYHMLPDELCMLCSLFPGIDKLAFSVFWEITKDGKVLSHRFSKTIINSCCQLAYEHAQAILEDRPDAQDTFPETYNGFTYNEIKKSIQIIGSLAAIFRKNRFDGGALRIDQPKVSFKLDPTSGLPSSFCIYQIQESHQMIEEFMLLANMTVAQRIYDDHPQLAFLRCHPPPSGYMLKQLAKSLSPLGIELDISTAGTLHRSLLPYTSSEAIDKGKAMVLNMLCAKPMTRAKYFCAAHCEDDDFHHYALNVPLYTHFTSPIRRYADIMVHRLLAASLKYRETPNWEVDKVRMIAAQCNKQKYNAKKAGEMSSELYMLKYIEMNSPFLTEAVVVEVKEKYIDVIVVAMGLNRRIFFNNDFPGEFNCIKNEDSSKMSKMELKWRAEEGKQEVKQIIEVFSIIQVQLHKGDDMIKVETNLIRPE